jgi:hypothetical protein
VWILENFSSFEKGYKILLCDRQNRPICCCCSCLVRPHAELTFCNIDLVYVKLYINIQKWLYLVYILHRNVELRCNCSMLWNLVVVGIGTFKH